MKQIKLKRVNSRKYCLNCGKIVQIKMVGPYGACCDCGEVIYTILNNGKDKNGRNKK